MFELKSRTVELYKEVMRDKDAKAMRDLCLNDLFYLLLIACKRIDIDNDWLFERCREVEKNPDGYIDLWAREHYKSTIITFGKTIQDILKNPEITIGIFSHTRPIAKAFLVQIKREFEINTFLQGLFPDVLYKDPQKESPKWSLDDGIIVNRKGNPKEATVEAWGLVDGQPTSKHYDLLVYDDVVTKESVSTPEMIQKVTESFSLSLNLGKKGGLRRYIGTRYHAADTYQTIMDRNTAKPRIYPATDDGTFAGNPVLFTKAEFEKKVEDMGSYIAGAQLLLNPLADSVMSFHDSWIQKFKTFDRESRSNFYILVDPASEKKKTNDYTVMVVIALNSDNNYYLVDGVRDRLNLTERTNKLFEFVRLWQPLNVGYEKYGMQSDIEHIRYVQEKENYRFKITELGGPMPKNDRIRRLVPKFENGRFYIPNRLMFRNLQNEEKDFVKLFIEEEYTTFPVSKHDDMLDCISRILDEGLEAKFPRTNQKRYESPVSSGKMY